MSALKTLKRIIKWALIITVTPFILLIVSGFVYGIMLSDSYEAVKAYVDFRNNRTDNNIDAAYQDAQNVLILSKDDSTLADARAYIAQYPALKKQQQEDSLRQLAEEDRQYEAYAREKVALIKKFNLIQDDYNENDKFYCHKSIRHFNEIDRKNFYLYFRMASNADEPTSLFLRVNYFGNYALDLKDVILLADEQKMTIDFREIKRKNLGNGMAEWAEIDMIAGDAAMLESLNNATTVKMRLRGKDMVDEVVLDKKEITAASETYRLFKAMGGDLSPRTVRVEPVRTEQDRFASNNARQPDERHRTKRTWLRVSKRHWLMGGGYTIRETTLNDHGYDGRRIN
jgi:hypothetical protein